MMERTKILNADGSPTAITTEGSGSGYTKNKALQEATNNAQSIALADPYFVYYCEHNKCNPLYLTLFTLDFQTMYSCEYAEVWIPTHNIPPLNNEGENTLRNAILQWTCKVKIGWNINRTCIPEDFPVAVRPPVA